MIYKKTWTKTIKKGYMEYEYLYEGYFLFFVIPVFIKRTLIKSFWSI